MITLSICIPTYNRCEFLMQNLNYFKLHNSEDIEIVISDNASTDATEVEVQSIIQKNNLTNFHYYKNINNIGPDANFKRVLSLAQGKYALLLGDDDFLKDDFFENVIPFLKKKEMSFIALSSSEMIEKNKKFTHRYFKENQMDQFLITIGPHITFMSIMIFNTMAVKTVLDTGFSYEQNLYQSFLAIEVIQLDYEKEYATLFYNPFTYNGDVSAENYDFYTVFVKKIIRLYEKALGTYDREYLLKIYGKAFKYYLFKFTIILKAIGIKKKIGLENEKILEQFPVYWFFLRLCYSIPSPFLSNCYKIYKNGKQRWKKKQV